MNMALWRSWLARRPVTAEVAGSSPVRVASWPVGQPGSVAQLVERPTENRKVTGSTPVGATNEALAKARAFVYPPTARFVLVRV